MIQIGNLDITVKDSVPSIDVIVKHMNILQTEYRKGVSHGKLPIPGVIVSTFHRVEIVSYWEKELRLNHIIGVIV